MAEEIKFEDLAFISYLDEYGMKQEGRYEIVSCNGFLLKFRTSGNNIITIPMSRVLKIKEKEIKGEDDGTKRS